MNIEIGPNLLVAIILVVLVWAILSIFDIFLGATK